jgi:chaperone required for assembly of F1-ATPase
MEQGASPRRFYTAATCAPVAGGWGVMLDQHSLRTPAKTVLCVPGEALARLIAAEWAAQGSAVVPTSMPITRLANLAQDRGAQTAGALADEIASYAGSDLVCYRTPAPQGLAARQAALWDPVLDWLEGQIGTRLLVTYGLTSLAQPEAAIRAIRNRAGAMDPWVVTGTAFVTGLTGSAALGLMLEAGATDAKAVLEAIRIEEDWNAAIWGRDDEEAAQAASRHADLIAAERYFRALTPSLTLET